MRQYFFDTNYFQLLMGLRSFQKSEFLKLIIYILHYFWCQNWDQWHKMSGKNAHIYFFYFWFKKKWVWAEKIGRKWKDSKNLSVAGNYPKHLIHTSFSIFFYMKNKKINFKNSDFSSYWGSQLVQFSKFNNFLWDVDFYANIYLILYI